MTARTAGARPFTARALTAGLVIAALSLLAGCSAQAPAEAALGSESNAAAATLSGELTVAAAASLQPAFEELSAAFTAEHPGVTFAGLSFDGSATLAKQIIEGAPVDVFASADEANMNKVIDAGLGASTPIVFATSSLQIVVAAGNPLDIKDLADLAREGVVTVVCAPEVPCGAAATKLLSRDGVTLAPASEEQNVTAVLTKVVAGEADAGLVYRSDVLRAGDTVEGIEIEGSIEAAGSYVIAPIRGTKSPEAAQAFADYLRSPKARALLDSLGFGPA